MASARETELQFYLAPAEAERLRAHPLLAGAMKDAASRRLVSTYFDTKERSLEKAGLYLRVREISGGFVQTLKRHDPTTLERGEWEWPVPGPSPDLRLTARTPCKDRLRGLKAGDLTQLFAVTVERAAATVAFQGATVEVAFDRGEIAVGAMRAPISELELELKAGSRRGMFAMARKLARAAPLDLSLISKGERGHMLAAGHWGKPAKAIVADVTPEMTAGEAFAAIGRSCLRQFAANRPAFANGEAVEAVHQSRIAVRRLRAAISLFSPILRDGRFERFKQDFKHIADALGEARDLDVMEVEDEGMAQAIESRRKAAHAALGDVLSSQKVRRSLLEFVLWCEAGAWRTARRNAGKRDEPAGRFIARRLSKWRKSFAKSAEGIDDGDLQRMHELRIKAKKLRYMAEFCGSLADADHTRKRLKRFLKAIEKMQETIGVVHDAQTRLEFAASHASASDTPPDPLGDSPEERTDILRRIKKQAAKAIAVKPLLDA